jgi:hypothetical protein
MPGEREYLRLVQVANQAQAAVGIAIERAVADGNLALVARGQQKRAELVGVFHQHGSANAGLQVFLTRKQGHDNDTV